MYRQKIVNSIHQANRYLIAAVSTAGFMWDGFQVNDLFFISAMLLWIWQPEWDQWEAHLLTTLLQITKGNFEPQFRGE